MPRRLAIADIHGCAQTFNQLLKKLELEKQDQVYLLGDYIDRGPDSKGVLDTIMNLIADGYAIQPLLGNHEKLFVDTYTNVEKNDSWRLYGTAPTLDSFRVSHPQDTPVEYYNFLTTLPTIAVTDDYVLVHAGLDFSLTDPINGTPEDFRLCGRNYSVKPEKIGNRTLVVGHTVTDLLTIEGSVKALKEGSLEANCIRLDNGCYDKGHIGFGSLVALDLDSKELVRVENSRDLGYPYR